MKIEAPPRPEAMIKSQNASRRKNQNEADHVGLEQRRSSCACGAGCEFAGTVASGKMDEKLKRKMPPRRPAESVAAIDDRGSETGRQRRRLQKKVPVAARTPARTELSINELEKT